MNFEIESSDLQRFPIFNISFPHHALVKREDCTPKYRFVTDDR